MIEHDPRLAPAVPLDRERQELEVAIRLVAAGGARRVVVAGLVHGPELIARMSSRAMLAGVQLQPLPADTARAVVVVPRPTLLG